MTRKRLRPRSMTHRLIGHVTTSWVTSTEIWRQLHRLGVPLSRVQVQAIVGAMRAEGKLERRCRRLPGVSRPGTNLSHGRHTWEYQATQHGART